MAKRGRKPRAADGHEGPHGSIVPQGVSETQTNTESRVEAFAEDLGRLLGTARAKAEGWLGQRQTVAKHLEEIRDTAAGLLNQLTGVPERRRAGRARTTRPPVPMGTLPADAKPRRKRRMSAAARKAVSARMTKYWAARRKEKS